MARTPLFRQLRRTLDLARHSLATDHPLDEFLERAAERRAISRRSFLGYSGATAAGALLAACRAPLRSAPRRLDSPVLVVGAGIAGLTAAYRLRQGGVPVRIVEAQNRVGGRMYSLRDYFDGGQVAELGGELIDTGHTHIRALAGELGIELDDLSADDPALDSDVWYFGGQRRSHAEVVEAFRPIAARIARDVALLGGTDVTYRTRHGAESLDRLSVAEYLERAGARGWVRDLLDVGYTTEYGLETDRQSALNLLLMIDAEPDPFRIFGESDERFHVRGGNDLIPQRLAERLADAIETGTVLEAVSRRPDGRYVATMRRGEGVSEATAEHLVLAIPFTVLRDVRMDVALPAAKRRAIAELGYGTNAKLMIGFGARPWREAHRSNGSVLTDLPFQLTWETSRLQDGGAGILTNFTGGRQGEALAQGTPAEQAARTVAGLERVFPGAARAREGMKEARFHWPSFAWTRGSYASYLPGQWTSLAGAEGEPVGNLHFAGEHCSLEAQGYMEGGCETGERVAEEVLEALGVRALSAVGPGVAVGGRR